MAREIYLKKLSYSNCNKNRIEIINKMVMSLRTGIKNVLNKITHPFGLNIERYFGSDLGLKQIHNVFKQYGINLLLDIGANTGQYALSILRVGYNGRIISFEPLNDVYEILKTNKLKHSNWRIFERTAVGDYCGKTMINISDNRASSSILPISENHTKVAPLAKYVDQAETSIITIDSFFSSVATPSDKVCLKIDTQGFEDKVLAGAKESLKKIKLIQLELSLIPLYDGSKTIELMLPYLKSLGFEPLLFLTGFFDRTTEQIQQVEGLFINRVLNS